jgi:purine-binding chemotaxis protein CheW
MGVVADQVSQVLDFGPADIGEPPTFGTRIRVDYIVGMGRVGKKFVHILDSDGVLSAGELTQLADAVAPQSDDPAAVAPAAMESEAAAT